MNNNFKRIPMSIPNYEGRLFTEKPEIKEFYNFGKNIGINHKKLTPGSRQLIWLKCPVCGYEFEVTPNKFSGCDFCGGGVVRPGYNDVATLFPTLALDFVPELNPGIDLTQEAYSSTKPVRWKCHKCGEEWVTQIYSRILNSKKPVTITKCKNCLVIENRKKKYPELFESLDMNENAFHDLGTRNDLNWFCPEHGPFTRDWEYMVKYYKKHGKLPCCNGVDMHKKVKKKHLSDYSELVKEFSPNNTKRPEELTDRSSYMGKWICEEHGEYEMLVRYRTIEGRGCPACRLNENYFYKHHSELEKMYSKKNTKPFSDVRATDNDLLIWECDKGHEFTKTPRSITKQKENICPTCRKLSQYEVFKAKVLSLNENMVNLWDDEKNYQYYIVENKPLNDYQKFFGKCDNGHEGYFDVRAIARNGGTCPYCGNRKLMVGFNDIAIVNPALLERVAKEYRESASQMIYNPNKALMFECSDCHGTYQDTIANIENGINNCPYCAGKKVLSGFNDIKTMSPKVYERLAVVNKNLADSILYKPDRILTFECPDCHGEYDDTIVNIENGINNCPYCAGLKVLRGFDDLATVKPEIAKRLSKAYRGKASEILYKPERILLFECSDCHGEYSDTMANIDNGIKNCPYCAGLKVLRGFNDIATVSPKVLNHIPEALRESASKTLYRPGSYILVECSHCHGQYYDSIFNIENDVNNCPYCAGKKLLTGFNDIAAKNPELVKRLAKLHRDNASQIIYKPDSYFLFECPDCHGEYNDTIRNIENGIKNCPYCAGKKVLPGYNDVLTLYPALADEVYDIGNYMIGTKLNECTENSSKWSYHKCPDCGEVYRMRIRDRAEKAERGHRACPNCNYIAKNRVFIF